MPRLTTVRPDYRSNRPDTHPSRLPPTIAPDMTVIMTILLIMNHPIIYLEIIPRRETMTTAAMMTIVESIHNGRIMTLTAIITQNLPFPTTAMLLTLETLDTTTEETRTTRESTINRGNVLRRLAAMNTPQSGQNTLIR